MVGWVREYGPMTPEYGPTNPEYGVWVNDPGVRSRVKGFGVREYGSTTPEYGDKGQRTISTGVRANVPKFKN